MVSALPGFGSVMVGISATEPIKVEYTGTVALTVSNIAVTPIQDGLPATPTTLSFAAGDSAYVRVIFTPNSLGHKAL